MPGPTYSKLPENSNLEDDSGTSGSVTKKRQTLSQQTLKMDKDYTKDEVTVLKIKLALSNAKLISRIHEHFPEGVKYPEYLLSEYQKSGNYNDLKQFYRALMFDTQNTEIRDRIKGIDNFALIEVKLSALEKRLNAKKSMPQWLTQIFTLKNEKLKMFRDFLEELKKANDRVVNRIHDEIKNGAPVNDRMMADQFTLQFMFLDMLGIASNFCDIWDKLEPNTPTSTEQTTTKDINQDGPNDSVTEKFKEFLEDLGSLVENINNFSTNIPYSDPEACIGVFAFALACTGLAVVLAGITLLCISSGGLPVLAIGIGIVLGSVSPLVGIYLGNRAKQKPALETKKNLSFFATNIQTEAVQYDNDNNLVLNCTV